jgi:hypothetical protein
MRERSRGWLQRERVRDSWNMPFQGGCKGRHSPRRNSWIGLPMVELFVSWQVTFDEVPRCWKEIPACLLPCGWMVICHTPCRIDLEISMGPASWQRKRMPPRTGCCCSIVATITVLALVVPCSLGGGGGPKTLLARRPHDDWVQWPVN